MMSRVDFVLLGNDIEVSDIQELRQPRYSTITETLDEAVKNAAWHVFKVTAEEVELAMKIYDVTDSSMWEYCRDLYNNEPEKIPDHDKLNGLDL